MSRTLVTALLVTVAGSVAVSATACADALTDVETTELEVSVSVSPPVIARSSGEDPVVIVTTSVRNPTSRPVVFRFDGPPFFLSLERQRRGRTVGFGYMIREHEGTRVGPWALSFGTPALVWDAFETKESSWPVRIKQPMLELQPGEYDVIGIFAEIDTEPARLTVLP